MKRRNFVSRAFGVAAVAPLVAEAAPAPKSGHEHHADAPPLSPGASGAEHQHEHAAHEAETPVSSAISVGNTQTFAPEGIALSYKPVITTNGMTLPWKMVDGVKVFHLTPE